MVAFLGVLRAIWGAWNLLPGIIRGLLIGLVVAFISFHVGQHKQIRICEQQKEQSIAEAKRIDKAANDAAIKRSQEQADKYQKEALEATNQLNKAKDYYATLPEQCKIDDDFINRNNAIGSGDGVPDAVPSSKKRTPRSR